MTAILTSPSLGARPAQSAASGYNPRMLKAIGLGGLAAASLVFGALLAFAVLCTAATVLGWALSSTATEETRAIIDGFAAGALLVMLIDSMIPDARESAGRTAGLVATLGFAVAAALSSLS